MIFQDFDHKTKKLLLLFLSCLFCWWLLAASATCSASGTPEQTYTITETELSKLETNLAQLRSINDRLTVDLKVQSQEATALKQEVTELKKQLEQLQSLSQKQGDSLTTANRLLAEYATEAKRERLRIKAQRNGWIAATVLACIGLAIK